MTNFKKSLKMNIGKLNKKIKNMEEKKRSIEQNIKQLRTAREKLVVRLQRRNKSEIAMKAYKDENKHVEINEIDKTNDGEKLLIEFEDDTVSDKTFIETLELVEENMLLLEAADEFKMNLNIINVPEIHDGKSQKKIHSENTHINMEEKLLVEFQDDLDGDNTVIEALQFVEEKDLLLPYCEKTEGNLKLLEIIESQGGQSPIIRSSRKISKNVALRGIDSFINTFI